MGESMRKCSREYEREYERLYIRDENMREIEYGMRI